MGNIEIEYDVNLYLMEVIYLVIGSLFAYAVAATFSLRAVRRKVGRVLLFAIALALPTALWYATRHQQEGRCYVITSKGVRYLINKEFDSETGRRCKPVTPDLLERLRAYEDGARPRKIEGDDVTFFDTRTGEPIVWYFRFQDGRIDLFDLMGNHPETAGELLPVNSEAVEAWKAYRASRKPKPVRIPQPVDPTNYKFFDPVTGEALSWFSKDLSGNYAFFDAPGFHPITRQALMEVTPDVVAAWRQELDAREARRAREVLERQAEERRKAEEEARRAREAQIAEERRRREEEERLAREAAVGGRCDELAANPGDLKRMAPGVPFTQLRLNGREAVEACAAAIKKYPDELRFHYQYARALQTYDKHKAFELQKRNAEKGYPAAYDNLGWLYIDLFQNYADGTKAFQRGTNLGDPDSMVSLAELILKGRVPVSDPSAQALRLLQRASSLGHEGATFAYEQLAEATRQEAGRLETERMTQLQMMQVFQSIFQSMPKR